ncbi:MAG: hypothetical protein SNJ81_13525 [Cyanobacteriota bacterium]
MHCQPRDRLQATCDRRCEVYDGGQQPCLSAILLLGSARDVFRDRVEVLYQDWIGAIAQVLLDAGFDAETARQLGEDGAIAIQGSLILAQGLGDPSPFQRAMQQLPERLLPSTPT